MDTLIGGSSHVCAPMPTASTCHFAVRTQDSAGQDAAPNAAGRSSIRSRMACRPHGRRYLDHLGDEVLRRAREVRGPLCERGCVGLVSSRRAGRHAKSCAGYQAGAQPRGRDAHLERRRAADGRGLRAHVRDDGGRLEHGELAEEEERRVALGERLLLLLVRRVEESLDRVQLQCDVSDLHAEEARDQKPGCRTRGVAGEPV
eukprot:4397055-Prymnesium_polylepis.2